MHKLKIPVKNASPDLHQYLNNLRNEKSQNVNHLYFGSNEYLIIAILSLLGGLGFLWWAYNSHDIMMAPNYQWKAMLICSLGIIAVSYAMHFFLFTTTSSDYLGEFECIDGERWWNIDPYHISVIELTGLSDVHGTHILENGQYKKQK